MNTPVSVIRIKANPETAQRFPYAGKHDTAMGKRNNCSDMPPACTGMPDNTSTPCLCVINDGKRSDIPAQVFSGSPIPFRKADSLPG